MSGVKPLGARRAASLSMLGLSALATACSLLFPGTDTQCTTSADCKARGFAGGVCVANVCTAPTDAGAKVDATRPVDAGRDAAADVGIDVRTAFDAPAGDALVSNNDWSCLGHVHWPDASSGNVNLTVPFVDLTDMNPIPGIRVQACLKLDPSCSSPLTDAAISNEAGLVTLSVPSGYDGYLLSQWDASYPSLVYINPPAAISTVEQPEYLLTYDTLNAVAGVVGKVDGSTIMLDPSKGLLFLGAYDCNGAPAAGVSFSVDPPNAQIQAYIIGGLPAVHATATDSSGNGAFANVPPETVMVTATLQATGQVLGSTTGFSQASHITFLELSPSPSP